MPLVLSSARLKEPSEGKIYADRQLLAVSLFMMALWFIYTLSPVLLVFPITFFRSFQACSCRSHLVLLGWDVASTMIQGGCIARDCLVRESSPDVGSTAQPNADNPPAVRAPTQMNRTGHQMNGAIK